MISSILCFVMSIAWINFTAGCIVNLLKAIGFMTGLPSSVLNLTVLGWGNSLGDMSADVAMTKKGFGEMAITATMAGPIFNIILGSALQSITS
jgi:sodium/potassium/calcium exchanger 6